MKTVIARAALVVIPLALVVGVLTGLLIRPTIDRLMAFGVDHPDAHEEEDALDHEDEEEEHIALSLQAYQNLQLDVGTVELSDHTHMLRMPGEIIEYTGFSTQQVAAPVSGRVERLYVSPGISVRKNVPLCELVIVDDHLEQAQLRLLGYLTKQEIVEAELERLAPLASSGSVAGRKQLEWEYQQKELNSSLSRAKQELVIRGLSDAQVEEIIATRRAITSLTVKTPTPAGDALQVRGVSSEVRLAAWKESATDESDLTVEQLFVESGQNVNRGDPLCSLAAHGVLSICGHAFENEIDVVSQLAKAQGAVTVEFGSGDHTTLRPNLNIQYVDSHVDEETQAYRFYVPLPNEVVAESTDSLGRRFRTWKYKVGQRIHILIPAYELAGQIVVPRDAVVREGPDAYVFREHREEEQQDEGLSGRSELEEAHQDAFIEFEPVPVTIVHQDRSHVAIAPNEKLAEGDRIAVNSGYQLLLALKHQQSGGGQHHHH